MTQLALRARIRDAMSSLPSIRMCFAGSVGACLMSVIVAAEPPGTMALGKSDDRPVLTLEAAVHFALQNNPTLANQRQQHGIAAAQVIIADTYPFNPVLE